MSSNILDDDTDDEQCIVHAKTQSLKKKNVPQTKTRKRGRDVLEDSDVQQEDEKERTEEEIEEEKQRKKAEVVMDTLATKYSLSSEQLDAVRKAVCDGKSLFLTGKAGTGKSVTLNAIIAGIRKLRKSCIVLGSTGIAASNLPSGRTMHAFLGLGLAQDPIKRLVAKAKTKPGLILDIVKQKAPVIVIDEIGVADPLFFRKFWIVLTSLRHLHQMCDEKDPFAGLQVIMSGDFLQLPPVRQTNMVQEKRAALDHQIQKDKRMDIGDAKFVFQLPEWKAAMTSGRLHPVVLTQSFRQSEPQFIQVLNEARMGKLSEDSLEILEERLFTFEQARALGKVAETDPHPVELTSKRSDAYKMNLQRLFGLPSTEQHTYVPSFFWSGPRSGNEHVLNRIVDLFTNVIRDSQMDSRLRLRVGARVICTTNVYHAHGIANGSQGTVVGFKEVDSDNPIQFPVVSFDQGPTLTIMSQTMETYDARLRGKVYCAYIPLILGWAITIHKSQGMSLSSMQANLDQGFMFQAGMAYVALSRVRNLSGLFLKGVSRGSFYSDPDAIAYDQWLEQGDFSDTGMLEVSHAVPLPPVAFQYVSMDSDKEEEEEEQEQELNVAAKNVAEPEKQDSTLPQVVDDYLTLCGSLIQCSGCGRQSTLGQEACVMFGITDETRKPIFGSHHGIVRTLSEIHPFVCLQCRDDVPVGLQNQFQHGLSNQKRDKDETLLKLYDPELWVRDAITQDRQKKRHQGLVECHVCGQEVHALHEVDVWCRRANGSYHRSFSCSRDIRDEILGILVGFSHDEYTCTRCIFH